MSNEAEVKRLRGLAATLDSRPFGHKEILGLLSDILQTFQKCLPLAKLEQRKANKWVCNFGIKGMSLIMVERTHGSRGDTIPVGWRKQMINAIDEVLDFIESQP